MPFYSVYHAVPLTAEQQQAIAQSITEIHSRTFTAMTALVNVDFINVTGKPTFIGGHRRTTPSTIHGSVRDGPSRTPGMYQSLCAELTKLWDNVARKGDSSFGNDMVRVFITGGFIAGVEGGYLLPQAGQDKAWLEENLPDIEKNAANGHEESIAMLESIQFMKSQSGDLIVG